MSIQSIVRELKASSGGPLPRAAFLTIFACVVATPFVIFILGGRSSNISGQPGSAWSFALIALLLITSVGLALWMFRQEAKLATISPKQS